MNGARAGLGARVDALDPADQAVPRQALDRHARRHAGRDARNVGERGLRLHFQVREVDELDERRIEAHLFAGLDMALRHQASDRRAHDGVVQHDLRLLELRLGQGDGGELRLVGAFGGVKGVLRDEVLLQELAVGIARALRHGELGLRRGERGRALGELRAQLRRVEFGERLAGAHAVALAHPHAPHFRGELGAHGRLRYRLHGSRQLGLERKAPALESHDIPAGEFERRLRGVPLGGLLARAAMHAQRADGDDRRQRQHHCKPHTHARFHPRRNYPRSAGRFARFAR